MANVTYEVRVRLEAPAGHTPDEVESAVHSAIAHTMENENDGRPGLLARAENLSVDAVDEEPESHIVITGGPGEGFEFIGPFEFGEDAQSYGDLLPSSMSPWWVAQLSKPEE